MRSLFALVLSGCTLVVGSDPNVDTTTDAGAQPVPEPDAAPAP